MGVVTLWCTETNRRSQCTGLPSQISVAGSRQSTICTAEKWFFIQQAIVAASEVCHGHDHMVAVIFFEFRNRLDSFFELNNQNIWSVGETGRWLGVGGREDISSNLILKAPSSFSSGL